LATEQELSLETMRNVGTAAVRNAMLMNASSVSFAAALQDQNVKKLDVGDVAGAVVAGAILASDLRKDYNSNGSSHRTTSTNGFTKRVPHFSSARSRGSMKRSRRQMPRSLGVRL